MTSHELRYTTTNIRHNYMLRCCLAMIRGSTWSVPALLLLIGLGSSDSSWAYMNLELGDPCATSYRSSCQPAEQCPLIGEFIRSGRLTTQQVENCGFTSFGEKICCPLSLDTEQRFDEGTTTTTTTTTSTTTTTTTRRPTTTSTSSQPSTAVDPAPDWLSIFNTSLEFVASEASSSSPSPKSTRPPRASSFVYPGSNSLKIGADCQAPLYDGVCLAVSQCATLEKMLAEQRLSEDDVESCHRGTREEIICCPPDVPINPRGLNARLGTASPAESVTELPTAATAVDAVADSVLRQHRHLAALAYQNAAFDGFQHRCTAVALTSQLLLTAASCAPDGIRRPSHAVFGVADLRDADQDEDYLVEITRIVRHRNDLALLALQQPLRLGGAANVSLAPLCSQLEQTRLRSSGQLRATAWAKGNESTDCSLYDQPLRLLPTAGCASVANVNAVIGLPASHFCVAPILSIAPDSDSCAPCLAEVGSVLHLLRADGSRCVMGVATPTGADCSAQALYYTSISDQHFSEFIEQTIEQQPTQENPQRPRRSINS